jgi:hypothetical protein
MDKFKIKMGLGKYNALDREYSRYICNNLKKNDDTINDRFELYNLIMVELSEIGDKQSFDEVKYRVTDGEDINFVMLDIVKRYLDTNIILYSTYTEILEYISKDLTEKYIFN